MCLEIGLTQNNQNREKNGDRSILRSIEEIKTKLCTEYTRNYQKVNETTNESPLRSFNIFVEPNGLEYGMESCDDNPPLNPIVVARGPEVNPKRLVKPYHPIKEEEEG